MSLFASAFDAGAGPSTISSPVLGKAHKDGKKKRKRSDGESKGSAERLKSTEANLHKLMQRVDTGQITEKQGGDAMGGGHSGSRKGVGKKRPGQAELAHVSSTVKKHRSNSSAAEGSPAKTMSSIPNGTAQNIKHDRSDVDISSSRPTPAELPLPHKLSAGKAKSAGSDSLTDMQKGMQSKLEGARFRWINEQLYSNPSVDAVSMMKADPKIFEDYHQTHRALTSAWPSPPLPYIIALLAPLPPKTVIVDLGCGDAGLAKGLVPQGKIVLSYDLVGDSGRPGESSCGGWVVEADFLEQVPLPGRPGGSAAGEISAEQVSKKKKGKAKAAEASEVVDVVVCCLSLMGTNWVGGIYEACRILKQGGTLHIAEVTSRFVSEPAFVDKVESFGFTLEHRESPSTHFTLFRFAKMTAIPLGAARGDEDWQARVKEGVSILRGCVYKKR